MDIASFFASYWDWITAAPSAFVGWTLILISATVAVTRVVLGDALEASRERLLGAQEEVLRLRGEKTELVQRLEQHGEDIEKINIELANLPRIHVSDRPPGPDDKPKGPNDLWVQT